MTSAPCITIDGVRHPLSIVEDEGTGGEALGVVREIHIRGTDQVAAQKRLLTNWIPPGSAPSRDHEDKKIANTLLEGCSESVPKCVKIVRNFTQNLVLARGSGACAAQVSVV